MELNKAVLDCMQTLRRRLREELGTDIHLNQSDAVSALLAACERSDSLQTRQLGEQLARLCGQLPPPEAASAAAPAKDQRQVRIYRGQRIYV